MDRGNLHEFYCFIHNGNGDYYSQYYDATGKIIVQTTRYPNMKPIEMSPANLKDLQQLFATNKNYFSGVRAMMLNWKMIGDGANILRHVKYTGRGYAEELYLLILRYNPTNGIFEEYYNWRFDLAQCGDMKNYYEVKCLDSSCWGVVSQNDDTDFSLDCTENAVNAVPILFDGINLKARYTWQTVPAAFTVVIAPIVAGNPPDLVLINTDGDSTGIVTKNQVYIPNYFAVTDESIIKNNYIYKPTRDNHIRFYGSIPFRIKSEDDTGSVVLNLEVDGGLSYTEQVLSSVAFNITNSFQYQQFSFDVQLDLNAGEYIRIDFVPKKGVGEGNWTVIPDLSNIYIETNTRSDASIIWGRRPLDVLQEIVARASNNKFTANSNFFAANKDIVLTCGNALRKSPNAKLKTSFKDFFKAYDIEYFLAFRIIGKELWIEPAKTIYDDSTNLFDVGEVSDWEVSDAYDYLCNEIELNNPKQDYRHTSGRLEFNGLNTFSIFQYNVKNKISLISPYRKDCYGMEFIRYDYQQQSTEDNSGDDTVFMVKISDQQGSAGQDVFNYEEINVNNQPLSPIIHYPLSNDVIQNNKPVVKGQCQPNTLVNVYVDSAHDGSTTSDADGYFEYNIVTPLSYFVQDVNTGIHTIDVTFTDLTGTLSTRTITCVDEVTNAGFDNVLNGENLYNNKPLLRGFLEAGTSAPLKVDGVTIATITGDGNCRWSFKIPRLTNGAHVLTIGNASIGVNVFSFVELPLVTSFADDFQLVNNLPLVEGVAKPGTKVDLYLDYYPEVPIGTAFADSYGNWSVQLVPMVKEDGTTPLTPIPNGNHIISTSLDIDSVEIGVKGYLLSRPAYDSIEGVLDDTVFNTELTPKHNLLNRMVYWKSIFAQQPNTVIKFETGDKNSNFATTLNGITTRENEDVRISQYPDEPLFYPYIFKAKVVTPFFFVEIIENFNSGGLVRMTVQGTEIFCLPIGKMSSEDVTSETQTWELLVSAKTPFENLLRLSTPGLIIKSMSNTIFRSDYNTLHMVKYDFHAPINYDEQPELYEDLHENRNQSWVNNPPYIQKLQRSDNLVDQIIVNSVFGTVSLSLYNCSGYKVGTFAYNPVTPAPIPTPDVVLQATVNWGNLPEGDYYFTMDVGGLQSAISEVVSMADRHYGTILIDAGNSRNKVGAIFSNGFRARFRVEGLVEKFVGNLDNVINEDEIGDYDTLSSVATRKRTVLFGNGKGIPDYLYLKICQAIALDDLKIQGVGYTISPDATIAPVNKIEGYPMYYYSVDFFLKDNQNGYTFEAPLTTVINNVVLVVDAAAFGVGGSQLAMIELDNEALIHELTVTSWVITVDVPTNNYNASLSIASPKNLVIDWGDGTIDTITNPTVTSANHTYVNTGVHNITINGTLEANGGKITPGDNNAGVPSISAIVVGTSTINCNFHNMEHLFRNCTKLATIPVGMFHDCPEVNTLQNAFTLTAITSIPADLFSKNLKLKSVLSTFNTCTGLTSIPANLFALNTAITNFQGTFNGCSNLTSVPAGLFRNCLNVTTFQNVFQDCTKLTSVPAALFERNTEVTTFAGAFLGSGLTSISATLFANNRKVTLFSNTFQNSKLTSIPAGLFDNNTEVTTFLGCFLGNLITSVPDGLFDKNLKVTSFQICFSTCANLVSIPSNLFEKHDKVTSYANCFLNCANLTGTLSANFFNLTAPVTTFTGTFDGCVKLTGAAPTIWLTWPSAVHTNTFRNDKLLSNWQQIPGDWRGLTATTRFNFGRTGTGGSIVIVKHAGWTTGNPANQGGTSPVYILAGGAKDNSATVNQNTSASGTALPPPSKTMLGWQYVTNPLPAQIIPESTFKAGTRMRFNATTAPTVYGIMAMRLVNADNSIAQEILVFNSVNALSSVMAIRTFGPVNIPQLTIAEGQRLVIEIGGEYRTGTEQNVQLQWYLRNDSAGDINFANEGNTAQATCSWCEFDKPVYF